MTERLRELLDRFDEIDFEDARTRGQALGLANRLIGKIHDYYEWNEEEDGRLLCVADFSDD